MREFVESISVIDDGLAVEIALALSRLRDENDELKYEIVIRPGNIAPYDDCIVDVYKNVKEDDGSWVYK